MEQELCTAAPNQKQTSVKPLVPDHSIRRMPSAGERQGSMRRRREGGLRGAVAVTPAVSVARLPGDRAVIRSKHPPKRLDDVAPPALMVK